MSVLQRAREAYRKVERARVGRPAPVSGQRSGCEKSEISPAEEKPAQRREDPTREKSEISEISPAGDQPTPAREAATCEKSEISEISPPRANGTAGYVVVRDDAGLCTVLQALDETDV